MSKIKVEYFDESEVFTIFKNFIPSYISNLDDDNSLEIIDYLNKELLPKSKSFKSETDLFQFETKLRSINLKDNEYENYSLYEVINTFIDEFYYECDKQLEDQENINVKVNENGKNLKKFKEKN
jgi:hypothetical protein